MANLYYGLRIDFVGEDNEPIDSVCLKKLTGLPFPSPIGTKVFIPTDDGFFATVCRFVHRHGEENTTPTYGDFFMILREESIEDSEGYPCADQSSFDNDVEELKKSGWLEVDWAEFYRP